MSLENMSMTALMERKDEYEVLGFTDWELKASSEKFCGKSVWFLRRNRTVIFQ